MIQTRKGIIPAYAGSTFRFLPYRTVTPGSSPHTRGARRRCARTPPPGGDHPRIRGEHLIEQLFVREKLGIIPAYAGSTLNTTSPLWLLLGSSPHTRGALFKDAELNKLVQDHPRIRGEHAETAENHTVFLGIIPAYAGSTLRRSGVRDVLRGSSPHTRGARSDVVVSGTSLGDHPRIRGEHRARPPALDEPGGIIPAYAGSTRCTGTAR